MRLPLLAITLVACKPELPACEVPGTICTIAGVGGQNGYNGKPAAVDTWFYFPSALAFDADGRLVVDDFNNNRIRALEQDGTVTSLVGVGMHAFATEGAPALETALENPVDIAYGPEGELYIAEMHGGRILRVDEQQVIEVVAGVVGELSFGGDGGPATSAYISQICGVDVTPDGALIIADTDNHRVRLVRDGIITTLAGDGVGGLVDGVDGVRLNKPQRLVWHEGYVYVADTGNHAIRRVDVDSGETVTLAGSGSAGFSGDGGLATAATLSSPFGVSVDEGGGVWIADSGNHRVRHIGTDGRIRTVAGSGVEGFGGDLGPAEDAALNFPGDVLPDGFGGLFVADMKNGAVRHIAGPLP